MGVKQEPQARGAAAVGEASTPRIPLDAHPLPGGLLDPAIGAKRSVLPCHDRLETMKIEYDRIRVSPSSLSFEVPFALVMNPKQRVPRLARMDISGAGIQVMVGSLFGGSISMSTLDYQSPEAVSSGLARVHTNVARPYIGDGHGTALYAASAYGAGVIADNPEMHPLVERITSEVDLRGGVCSLERSRSKLASEWWKRAFSAKLSSSELSEIRRKIEDETLRISTSGVETADFRRISREEMGDLARDILSIFYPSRVGEVDVSKALLYLNVSGSLSVDERLDILLSSSVEEKSLILAKPRRLQGLARSVDGDLPIFMIQRPEQWMITSFEALAAIDPPSILEDLPGGDALTRWWLEMLSSSGVPRAEIARWESALLPRSSSGLRRGRSSGRSTVVPRSWATLP